MKVGLRKWIESMDRQAWSRVLDTARKMDVTLPDSTPDYVATVDRVASRFYLPNGIEVECIGTGPMGLTMQWQSADTHDAAFPSE